MATQIAATPVIRGEEAVRVMKEAQQKSDDKTLKAFAMLEEEFSKIVSNSKRLD